MGKGEDPCPARVWMPQETRLASNTACEAPAERQKLNIGCSGNGCSGIALKEHALCFPTRRATHLPQRIDPQELLSFKSLIKVASGL